MIGKVLERKETAVPFAELDDLRGNFSPIERIAAFAGNQAITVRQIGILEYLADVRSAPIHQIRLGRIGPFAQRVNRRLPAMSDDLAHGKSLLRVVDRRYEQLSQALAVESLAQFLPAIDASGNRPRERSRGRKFGVAQGHNGGAIEGIRAAAAGIQTE